MTLIPLSLRQAPCTWARGCGFLRVPAPPHCGTQLLLVSVVGLGKDLPASPSVVAGAITLPGISLESWVSFPSLSGREVFLLPLP